MHAEGNADDQARRLQDQGAAAHRQGSRRLCRPRRVGGGGIERRAAPRARTRPGHNTPLLVLYGSNLGTAEELATRVADLAEVNGFATKLAPLDDFVGKLPEQGGVLIFCASYNGAPPDNATQFVKWLGGDLPKDAFAKVRYAVFGCGNSDWAATYQSVPRFIDEQLAAHGARSVYARGEGDARSDLDGQFESWFANAAPLAVKEFGVDIEFQPQRRRRAALHDRAGGAVGGQRHRRARRRRADEGAGQLRTAEQDRRQCVRPLDPAYRGATAGRRQLPRRRSSQRGAAQRSGAGRFRRAPLRLPAGRPDPAAGRRRPPRAIAGRRRRLGRAAVDRVRRIAAGRDPQADPDHVGTHALSDDQAETAGLCRRRCRLRRALSRGGSRQAQIGVRPAGGTSGLRTAVPRLSRNAVAAGAALLFDLVVAVGRCRRAAASPSAWSRRPPVRAAASTRASARIISPAAAPARPSTPRCAKPRPASGCRTMRRCRSS